VLAHEVREPLVHVARFGAVANAQLAFCGSHAERAGHQHRQRVRELRLEHRTFARDHAVVPRALLGKERRKDLRHLHLAHGAEVARGALRVEGHARQLDLLIAEHGSQLTDHLFDA
jgi:hypothetical protein